MAKSKAAKKEVKKSNPSLQGVPWKEPFPAPKLNKDGEDEVIVRAIPTQDLRINGTLKAAGVETTLTATMAHAHAAALAAPADAEE